jgi:hypothetical protein
MRDNDTISYQLARAFRSGLGECCFNAASQREAVLFVKRTKNFLFPSFAYGFGQSLKLMEVFCFFFTKKKHHPH